jgi:hypothetical protein
VAAHVPSSWSERALAALCLVRGGAAIALSFTSPEKEFICFILMKSLLHREKKNALLLTTGM